MYVSIIGLGGVGLNFAVSLADKGYNVFGIDIDRKKVEAINRGKSPFYEPSLEEKLISAMEKGLLKSTTSYEEAIPKSKFIFVTVGTPFVQNTLDMSYVKRAVSAIGKTMDTGKFQTVAVRSTLLPWVSETLLKPILERETGTLCGEDFGLCYNPEFLARGKAIEDITHPDFVIIGEANNSGGELKKFYEDFLGSTPIIRAPAKDVELLKLVSNAYLATKISFANSVGETCDRAGVDANEIFSVLGMDKRISSKFLKKGMSYGGPCFPRDLSALIAFVREIGCNPHLFEATEKINNEHTAFIAEQVGKKIGGIKNKHIVVLGLAYKPEIDDVTNSASIKLVQELNAQGAKISVYDPKAMEEARKILGDTVEYLVNPPRGDLSYDCCIIATPWKEFEKIQFSGTLINPWR